MFDAIIVGGSYAGLSAALQLARAHRSVLVIDAGSRRNRFAASAHGFLGQDGRDPAAIAADGRAQLLAYPNAQWHDGLAEDAEKTPTGFSVRTAAGDNFVAQRLILALGVFDELPPLAGLAQLWGKSIFHCPYCHGYELDQGPIGVLGLSAHSMHQALMLPDWGPTTLFLQEGFTPDADQAAQLQRRGVTVETSPIAAFTGHDADVRLHDGRVVALAGLFTASRTRPSSPLAERLGCAHEETPHGAFIETGSAKLTSVPGVYACGDAARAMGSVALAVSDGAMAGMAAHQSLIFGED